jgi:GGDEF domain-containing protein
MLRTSPEGTERAAERLRAEIAKQTLLTPKGPVSINVSIGAAHMEMLDEPVAPHQLVELADSRLYAAKKALKREAVREATGGIARE